MIYFDNAATTFPKPKCVITEVVNCLKLYCGNPGRSSHKLALAASEKIYESREALAKFLSVEKSENIVFTPNATHALNIAIKGLLKENCHYITSDIEHNSVLRPIYKCVKTRNCSFSVYNSDLPLREAIIPLIRDDTRGIITTLASNVTGKIQNIQEISEIATKYNLKLIVDASQYLGHKRINLKNINYDVLCSAGHKALFGIQGSGFAVFNRNEELDTIVEGGSGVDSFSKSMPGLLPERFEAGTVNTPAIVSLLAGIKYINAIGLDNINDKIQYLTERVRDILSSFKDITLYGAENGIISFNKGSYSSSEIADKLNKENIATRAGFHCAPLIHQKLGTSSVGAIRISLSYMNTKKECDMLYTALKKC